MIKKKFKRGFQPIMYLEKKGSRNIMRNTSICPNPGEQVRPEFYSEVFGDVSLKLDEVVDACSATDEDLETGFLLFSAIIYCPESVSELFELYQFLSNLVDNETPRTLLQATVTTIKADIIQESLNKKRLNDFYLALETTFNLQFGKILLAIVSKIEMQMIRDKGWPFLESYRDEVNECIASESCQGIQDIIKELGKS